MITPPSIRVVLADSHAGMLATTADLLDGEQDVEVVATAADLDTAARAAAALEADVLVVDLHMLAGSSRARIGELRRRVPEAEIVILTMEATPAFVPAVLDAGASAYVLKEFAERDLAHAAREAVGGRRFVTDSLAA